VWSKILLAAAIFAPTLFSSAPAQSPQAASFVAGGTTFGRIETLQGKVIDLDLKKKLIFVKSPDNVTYKFVIASSAQIMSTSGQRLKNEELSTLVDKMVSVTFSPTQAGNMAQKIALH
jgi:hypothetical protein